VFDEPEEWQGFINTKAIGKKPCQFVLKINPVIRLIGIFGVNLSGFIGQTEGANGVELNMEGLTR